jgi:hypothetical protein
MKHKIIKKIYALIAYAIYLFTITGCAQMSINDQKTNLSKNWGKSYHQAKNQQILNKDNKKTDTPVSGLDGKAADSAYEKYLKSFEEKANKNTLQLDIPLK